MRQAWGELIGALCVVALGLAAIAAYLTHIIYCFKTASYLLLVAGAILPPIGTINGLGLWFGWW